MAAARTLQRQHGGSGGSSAVAGSFGSGGGSMVVAVIFRKVWYRKTGKEVIEGRPLLHRLLGFKGRCKDCLQLIITEL